MYRILVVEDDRSIRRVLEKFLEEQGYEVLTAGTGLEGLAQIRAEAPDLVLLDLNLPELDGIEVLKNLQGGGAVPCTIVVSARGDMRSTIQAIQAGAYDFLHKPLDIEKLKLTIQRALQTLTLKRRLTQLVAEVGSDYQMDQIVGNSPAIYDVYKSIAAATTNRATVLITGESGTGKELVARAIHFNSPWPDEPFMAVNCSAIAPSLLESELFGHNKGAFTGAVERRDGRFQMARRGTLFLDEIGEISQEIQVKLLRVLQERTFERVGDSRPVPLEARIVAATNRDLPQLVKDGGFREDLYYRLRVVEISLTPLRERREDIPLLIDHLLPKVSASLKKSIRYVTEEAREILMMYTWPGNIRELENTLTRAVVLARGDVVTVEELPPAVLRAVHADPHPELTLTTDGLLRLADVERLHILKMLARASFHKRNACVLLDLARPTLDKKIQEYDITEEEVAALVKNLREGSP